MVIEALLLVAFIIAFSVSGLSQAAILILGAIVLVMCLPVIRLIVQGAPPLVPTPKKIVDAMMQLADIKAKDRVYDLGCGDGRLLLAAAKTGATVIGLELSVPTVILAKLRTKRQKNITVTYADFWKQDYSNADVILCYLLSEKMEKFEREIWPTLKPGCRVVSHTFLMPNVTISARDGEAVLYHK